MSNKRKKRKRENSDLERGIERLANDGKRQIDETLARVGSSPLELPELLSIEALEKSLRLISGEQLSELFSKVPTAEQVLRELALEEKADPIEWLEDIICHVDRWRKRHSTAADPDGVMKEMSEELMEFRKTLISKREENQQ